VEIRWEVEEKLAFPYVTLCIPSIVDVDFNPLMWSKDYFPQAADSTICGFYENGQLPTQCTPVLTTIEEYLRCWVINSERDMFASNRNDQIFFSFGIVWAKYGQPFPLAVLYIHNDANAGEESTYIPLTPLQTSVVVLSLTNFKLRNGTTLYNYEGFVTGVPRADPPFCDDSGALNVCTGYVTGSIQFQNLRVQKVTEVSKFYAYYDFVSQLGGAISIVFAITNVIFGVILSRLLFRSYTERMDSDTREAILYIVKEQLELRKGA